MKQALRAMASTVLPPLIFLAAALVGWSLLVRGGGFKPYLLPGPELVFQAIGKDAGKLWQAMQFTGKAALGGLAASMLVGTATAIVFSQSAWIRRSGYPYAIFLQTVPIVAIAPLIVHWCGRGFPSIILTAFIISLFPIIANGTAGLLAIDPDLLDLFRLNKASRWQILWKLRLPNAVPALCTGARTSAGLAVVGAIVGEFFAGYGGQHFGLGYLILFSSDQARMADLFACVFASTGLGVTIFGAITLGTTFILGRWYDAPVEHRR
jgi:NitT/TauT family transport system permease protein